MRVVRIVLGIPFARKWVTKVLQKVASIENRVVKGKEEDQCDDGSTV